MQETWILFPALLHTLGDFSQVFSLYSSVSDLQNGGNTTLYQRDMEVSKYRTLLNSMGESGHKSWSMKISGSPHLV